MNHSRLTVTSLSVAVLAVMLVGCRASVSMPDRAPEPEPPG